MIILCWQRSLKACDTQGFCAPLYSWGASVPAGATCQLGEAGALLKAGTVSGCQGNVERTMKCFCVAVCTG